MDVSFHARIYIYIYIPINKYLYMYTFIAYKGLGNAGAQFQAFIAKNNNTQKVLQVRNFHFPTINRSW